MSPAESDWDDAGILNAALSADVVVRLIIPARPACLRYVRLAATAMGHDAGYDLAAVETLRVAVDESCALALECAAAEATLEVAMAMDERSVAIAGVCKPQEGRPQPDELSSMLLGRLAHDHETRIEGDTYRFRLRFAA